MADLHVLPDLKIDSNQRTKMDVEGMYICVARSTRYMCNGMVRKWKNVFVSKVILSARIYTKDKSVSRFFRKFSCFSSNKARNSVTIGIM